MPWPDSPRNRPTGPGSRGGIGHRHADDPGAWAARGRSWRAAHPEYREREARRRAESKRRLRLERDRRDVVAMTHPARDRGDGTCPDCDRRVADYGAGVQHRRGRIAGVSQGKRGVGRLPGRTPPPPRVRCRKCRRSTIPLRVFRLLTEHQLVSPSRAIVRKSAGSMTLCEPCWRTLTTEAA